MKNKKDFILLLIVGIQIILLSNFAVAQSYLISGDDRIDYENDSLENVLKGLVNFFKIKQIGLVSAQNLERCCVKGEFGTCYNFIEGEDILCTEVIDTACDNTPVCQLGCCVDEEKGTCDARTAEQDCDGFWDPDDQCNIAQCHMGCCLINDEAGFFTEKMCSNLADFQGKDYEFLPGLLEISCLAIPKMGEDGACVNIDGSCERMESGSCEGTFYKGYLCSSDELETGCERQASVGLVEDYDEIYWFDSCGNKENIYSSDEDASWNLGTILRKNESCGASARDGNAESLRCGNCDKGKGSVGVETSGLDKHISDGDFICKDINCAEAPLNGGGTGLKIHGDTWCLYDSAIGDSNDAVGSEHWVASCMNGKVEVDRCGEARSEVCEESTITQVDAGIERDFARCVVNQAQLCKGYNSELSSDPQGVKEKCEANTHCNFKEISVDHGFEFSLCLPKYPQGFDLRPFDDSIYGEETPDFASMTCASASLTCPVVKKRGTSLEAGVGTQTFWSDKLNSDCRNEEFVEKMNDFCISLGDCGSYTNYIGKSTDNIRVQGSNKNVYKESWADYFDYSENADAVAGQHVESQSVENLEAFTGGSSTVAPAGIGEDYHVKRTYENWLSYAMGASGSSGALMLQFGGTEMIKEAGVGLVPSMAPYAYPLIGAAIGAAVSSTMAKKYNIDGKEANWMVGAGIVGGATAGFAVAALLGSTVAIDAIAALSVAVGWSPFGWVLIAAIVVIAILVNSYIAGMRIGEVGKDNIHFYCYPWEAPRGGEDCGVCNEDPLKPCTRYRCESLGQLCQIMNEGGDENPVCVSVPLEANSPEFIDYRIETDGYKLEEVSPNKFKLRTNKGNCVPEFEAIKFVLETDEQAQCSWDWNRQDDYLETQSNLADENRYRKNHTFFVEEMPSVTSLDSRYFVGNVDEGYTGEQVMYITCIDFNGNPTLEPAMVDVCIDSEPNPTAAYIKAFTHSEETVLKYEETELVNWGFWLNRPAQCKWSAEKDKAYENMENTLLCELDPSANDGINGFPCEGTLTGLVAGENKVYIKCENSLERINTNDFEYEIKVTEHPLEMSSLKPTGNFEESSQPVEFEMTLSTSGGAYSGKSVCEFYNNGQWIVFKETSSTSHKQLLNFWSGVQSMPIKCSDTSGNIAEGTIDFELFVDDIAPKVLVTYYEAGKINFFTNEKADCRYSFETCNFGFDTGATFGSNDGIKHSEIWEPGETYHVKCRDVHNNENVGCAQQIAIYY
jgi:hypothetical protein